jgi:hypothetical protein
MEVHKHPHHVMQKKKWPEYLLEFLMIFLAVFLGFFAENIREHKVDKQRLLKEMNTIIGNLKYEKSQLASSLWRNVSICKGIDSFRVEIDKAIAGKVNANELYYYHWRFGRDWIDAVPLVSPMSLIQNSGMLRLIRNDTLVYDIGFYYEKLTASLNLQRNQLVTRQNILKETCKSLFDLHASEGLVQRDTAYVWWDEPTGLFSLYTAIREHNPPLKLLSTDSNDLKRLYTDLTLYEMEIHRFDEWLRWCLYIGNYLMKRIEIEYNLNIGKQEPSYASVGIVGPSTGKGWDTSVALHRMGEDLHQWRDTLVLLEGEVKFRVDNKWDTNWGETFFPNGAALEYGPNIPIPAAGTYVVAFNDMTGDYTFTTLSKGGP